MGEQHDDLVEDGSLPEGYETDPLTVALELPIVVRSTSSEKPESERPKDNSKGPDLLRRLADLRNRALSGAERLRRVVATNRDILHRAGERHGRAVDEALSGLNRSIERAVEQLDRLEGEVKFQHKEYLAKLAVRAPSATEYASQLDDKITPVTGLDRSVTDLLEESSRKIEEIISGAQQDIKRYHERVATDRKAWEDAMVGLGKKMDALTDLGATIPQDMSDELARIRKSAADDYPKAKEDVAALVKRCEEETGNQGNRIETLRDIRKQEIARIKSSMVIPKWWERLGDTWDVKQIFAKKMVQAERLVSDATNEKALLLALSLAKEAQKIFNDFTANEAAVEQMSYDQDAIKRVLDFYKDDRPKDYQQLKDEFDALEKGWSGKMPSDLAKDYAAMKAKVDGSAGSWNNFRGRCECQRRWREDFKAVADKVQEKLDDLDKKIKQASPVDGADGYQGSAKAELRGLTASAATEQSEGTTIPLLKRIQGLLAKVEGYSKLPTRTLTATEEPSDDKAKVFFEDQKAGLAARKAYKETREQLKIDHNLLIEAHRKLSDKSFSDEDKKEYEDIRKLINEAAKIANAREDEGDLQDLATAAAMVKRALERLALLEQGGPKIDRGKLGEMQNDWLNGLRAFKTKGEELVTAVRSAAEQPPADPAFADAADQVGKLVATAAGFFDGFSFAEETRVLADDAPGRKDERKRARETALAKIRQATDYLTKSPAMQILVDNRFGVSGLGTGLFRTLRRMELEVLRGV